MHIDKPNVKKFHEGLDKAAMQYVRREVVPYARQLMVQLQKRMHRRGLIYGWSLGSNLLFPDTKYPERKAFKRRNVFRDAYEGVDARSQRINKRFPEAMELLRLADEIEDELHIAMPVVRTKPNWRACRVLAGSHDAGRIDWLMP
jgi:hypothetical protein